jgi:hypothetical protein
MLAFNLFPGCMRLMIQAVKSRPPIGNPHKGLTPVAAHIPIAKNPIAAPVTLALIIMPNDSSTLARQHRSVSGRLAKCERHNPKPAPAPA